MAVAGQPSAGRHSRISDRSDRFKEVSRLNTVNGSGSEPAVAWGALIQSNSAWRFEGKLLVHCDVALQKTDIHDPPVGLKQLVVQYVYGTQNRSRAVRFALARLLDGFTEPQWGLNFGAGSTRVHPRILNLDIEPRSNTDIVNAGSELPFRSDVLDLVISQEVLEHVDNPLLWVHEIHRVLKPGGTFYCQLPFVIGYHPGPTDFWRFTKEAYPKLFAKDRWEIEQLELSVGHGTGLYRILVEFCAVTASALHRTLYMPVKGTAALFLAPLRLFDLLTRFSDQRDRIPGGYFCIVTKR